MCYITQFLFCQFWHPELGEIEMSRQQNNSNSALMRGTVVFYNLAGRYGFIRPDGTPPESIDFENHSSHDVWFPMSRERGFQLTRDGVAFSHLPSSKWPVRTGGDRVVFKIGEDRPDR
ncbi:MAG: hypothetical protein ABH846_04435, partial [Patescibacteria group bacterium]